MAVFLQRTRPPQTDRLSYDGKKAGAGRTLLKASRGTGEASGRSYFVSTSGPPPTAGGFEMERKLRSTGAGAGRSAASKLEVQVHGPCGPSRRGQEELGEIKKKCHSSIYLSIDHPVPYQPTCMFIHSTTHPINIY